MILETQFFQINFVGILLALSLLFLNYKNILDLISILAFTSSFYNLVIFNFKPWTFGFQIFYLFAILLVLKNLKGIFFLYKNQKFKKILVASIIVLFVILSSLFINLIDKKFILVFRPPAATVSMPQLEYSKIDRYNFTQFLYLLFYFILFLSILLEKVDIKKFIKFYLYGLNLTLLFQFVGIFLKIIDKPVPNFLNNLSFLNESIQDFEFYSFTIFRFSGLFPTPSLLGIYLFIALSFLILFKNLFSKKFFYTQIILLNLSGLLSFSSTYFLGLIILVFILLTYSKNLKQAIVSFFLFILLLIVFLFSIQKSSLNDRINKFFFNINIFLKNPIWGIGWSSTTGDLLSSIFANLGLTGLIAFIYFFYRIFLKEEITNESKILRIISAYLLMILLIIWMAFNINIFWILLGIYLNKKYNA